MKNSRLLIIEDELLTNKFLVTRFKKEEFQVDTAFDGQQALEMISATRYDLILSDLMMPNVAGLELVQLIKTSALNHAVPLIIMSSLSGDNLISEVLAIGAEDYISKPFSMELMVDKVKDLLNLNLPVA